MKACPYRGDFFKKLRADPNGGPESTEEELDAKLDAWLAALRNIVQTMEGFYEKGGYGKGL